MIDGTEMNPHLAGPGSGISRPHRRRARFGTFKAVALVWPESSSERKRVFETWESAAMPVLRKSRNGFALLIGLRNSLRSDGTITATNRELAFAAGCGAKAVENELSMLKASALLVLTFGSAKGASGNRRIIRLSLPSPDQGGRT